MRRPLADKRPFGPLVSAQANSAGPPGNRGYPEDKILRLTSSMYGAPSRILDNKKEIKDAINKHAHVIQEYEIAIDADQYEDVEIIVYIAVYGIHSISIGRLNRIVDELKDRDILDEDEYLAVKNGTFDEPMSFEIPDE